MPQKHQRALLERLGSGETSTGRKEILKELMALENEELFEDSAFLNLLSHDDSATQSYAIAAAGRQKAGRAIPRLRDLFVKSRNPLVLTALIDTFIQFGTDDFVKVVLQRLNELNDNALDGKGANPASELFDDAFILGQIIIPALKYFQAAGTAEVEPAINRYLDDESHAVRWRVLAIYDKLGIALPRERLQRIEASDTNALVREQAAIMLAKTGKLSALDTRA